MKKKKHYELGPVKILKTVLKGSKSSLYSRLLYRFCHFNRARARCVWVPVFSSATLPL